MMMMVDNKMKMKIKMDKMDNQKVVNIYKQNWLCNMKMDIFIEDKDIYHKQEVDLEC